MMQSKHLNQFHRPQQGAALFMALIFLVIITLLSVAAMRTSVMELRMAGNAEARVSALQRAQSIIDSTVARADNTPVIGDVDELTCLPGKSGCTRNNIVLKDDARFQTELDAGYIDVVVKRLAPLSKPAPRTQGYSLKSFSVATFEVAGSYDATAAGLGRAEIVEGVLVLIGN